MSKLSLVEATAVAKLGEQLVKSFNTKIEPGAYDFDFTCDVSGLLTKMSDQEAFPTFDTKEALEDLIVAMAMTSMDPVNFIEGNGRNAGKLTRKMSEIKEAKTAVEKYLAAKKEEFQRNAKKNPKAGPTSVSGVVAKVVAKPKKASTHD
jgi:hypothetical protein